MERTATLLSTAVRFLSVKNPRSDIFAPDLIEVLKERYRFWEMPQRPVEFDVEKGVHFNYGIFRGTVINSLQIFNNGLMIQGNVNTAVLDAMADELIEVAAAVFGAVLESPGPVKKRFSSSLEFHSLDMLLHAERLRSVASMLDRMVLGYGMSAEPYQPSTLALHSDPLVSAPFPTGRFIVERRANQPFTNNLFYSEAPVTTDEHEELLLELERSMRS